MRTLDVFLTFDGEINTNFDTQDQNQFCAAEHETEELLDEIDAAITAAISAIQNNTAPGANFVEEVMCPDSLMAEGDTCADFYIAGSKPTFWGLIDIGNGRGPMPYADITRSKFQFIPRFDQDSAYLLVNGSTIAGSLQLLPSNLGGTPHSIVITVPSSPWQIEKFDIRKPNATTRVVDFKITNADCAQTQHDFENMMGGGVIANYIDMLCPAIDATLTYTKVNGFWEPTYEDRDAFPTLDIWRKNSNGQLGSLYHSPEGPDFWRGLTGLERIRTQIRLEKQRLDQDQTCFTY